MNSPQNQPEDSQEISRWTRAYAQNRSLPVVVLLLIFLAINLVIGGASLLAGTAYRSGNMFLFWVAIAALVPAFGAIIFFSVPRWARKFQTWLMGRLYAKEGNVAFSQQNRHATAWGVILVVCFGTCVAASVILGFFFDIPSKYMQPISALYVVPFLVGLWLLMRPMAGYAALLWPLLYAIHAILILAGAPILFTGPWEVLNIVIPIAGYGLLASLAGHFYSRVALRHLKHLAQAGANHADSLEEARSS